MAARKRNWTPEIVRQRIRTGVITRYLMEHIQGTREMSKTQVSAALGLLKKTLPDLMSTEISGEIRNRDVTDQPLTADEWEQRYSEHAH